MMYPIAVDDDSSLGVAVNERRRWDARYAGTTRPAAPAPWLLQWAERLPPGRALDLACGSGGNVLALAERGWDVTGIDVSPVGLRVVQREARRRGLGVTLVAADLDQYPLPHDRYDVVCVFRFLERALMPAIAAALRPGGTLLYETFTTAQREQPGGPRCEAFLLEPGELPRLVSGLDVIVYEEGAWEREGKHEALARLVARRPSGALT
jgi:tellurite methyltransferase